MFVHAGVHELVLYKESALHWNILSEVPSRNPGGYEILHVLQSVAQSAGFFLPEAFLMWVVFYLVIFLLIFGGQIHRG